MAMNLHNELRLYCLWVIAARDIQPEVLELGD